ncbi:MAG: AsmA-like C-terminal region-containing protein [Salinibacter sp.]
MPDPDASSRALPTRLVLWGGGLLGGLLVLVLAAALLLPQFFTSEELKGYVVPPLEEATGRQVQIDEIRLRVLWTPAVSVSGFRLVDRAGYGPEPAVAASELNVEVAPWPLLTGRVRPTAVELVAPTIRYTVAEDGTANFDDLLAADTAQAAEEGEGLSAIPVSTFRTTGAQVRYVDRSVGRALALDFDARLRARPDGDALASDGTIDVQALRAVLPDVQNDTITVTDAQVTYDVRANLAAGRVVLSDLTVETAPATLTASGTVTRLATRPALDLTVETTEADLARIAAFAPAASRQLSELNPTGTLELTATVRGPLPDRTGAMDSLVVDGTGRLAGVGLDYQGQPLLRNLQADLSFSGTAATVKGIRGQLLGRRLEGEVTIQNPLGDATVEGRLAGAAALSELSALVATEGANAASVAGIAEYNVRFNGPLDTPDAIRPSGQVRLVDVKYPYASFRHPIEVPSATVRLTGTGLSMDRFTIRSGEQTMALRATARNLFPVSTGLAETDPAMALDVTFTADRLDLVELYAEADTGDASYSQLFAATLSGSQVNGRSPEAVASELYGGTELPAYAVDGRVEIGTFLSDPQRIGDLAFDVRMRNRRLVVQNLSGTTYGGQLTGSITLDQSGSGTSAARPRPGASGLVASAGPAPLAPSASALDYDVQLTGAQAGAFLEDWTMLGRVVKGTLDLNIDGGSPLSAGFLPLADALTAEGTSIVVDGGLSLDLGVTKALVDRLGLGASALTSFQRFGGPFTIEDGTLKMGTWTLGGATQAELTGALGLGGRVDVTLRMNLPVSALQDSKIPGLVGGGDGALGGLVQKLAGSGAGDATIPVRVAVGGTMREPTVEVVDKDAVRSALRQLVKEEGLGRLRNLLPGGGGRIGPSGSPETPDSRPLEFGGNAKGVRARGVEGAKSMLYYVNIFHIVHCRFGRTS